MGRFNIDMKKIKTKVTEEDKRFKLRVDRLYATMEKAFNWLEKHPDNICYIVFSQDDFGHNLQEDYSVYIIAYNHYIKKIGGVEKNPYYFWYYNDTRDDFEKNKFNSKEIINIPVKCFYNPKKYQSAIKIGETSKSGNVRTGEFSVMGIMTLDKYLTITESQEKLQ